MEKLIDQLTALDISGHVCLYGFDEESDDETETLFFPHGYIEKKSNKVRFVIDKTGVSLTTALSLCEVTPAEWELMKQNFISSQ